MVLAFISPESGLHPPNPDLGTILVSSNQKPDLAGWNLESVFSFLPVLQHHNKYITNVSVLGKLLWSYEILN